MSACGDMIVGLLAFAAGLPRNDRATALYRQYLIAAYPECDPGVMPVIAGPVVVFDEPVWD